MAVRPLARLLNSPPGSLRSNGSRLYSGYSAVCHKLHSAGSRDPGEGPIAHADRPIALDSDRNGTVNLKMFAVNVTGHVTAFLPLKKLPGTFK